MIVRNTMKNPDLYVVAYAKITVDKREGITLQGVYFGGLGTFDEAETIARECVDTIRGGTILPRIVKLDEDNLIVEALQDAQEKFEKVVENMSSADEIVNRGRQ